MAMRSSSPPRTAAAAAAAAAAPLPNPRNWVLQSVRLVLHLGVIFALTLRSAVIGSALHPFTRALANEWIHLLFYVETTKKVPIWDPMGQGREEDDTYQIVPVTLPHFLLEIEEEIAANVDDEFFSGGFAARASSYPVGMLFTIEETKQHLHGAIGNYFNLAEIALDSYILAGGSDPAAADIPFPELIVRYENGSETVDESFTIRGKNESEWPEPLQRDHTSTRTREFFALLDAMQLQFTVGMRSKTELNDDGYTQQHQEEDEKMFEWRVVFTYDLRSQGHLEVALNYGLRQTVAKSDDLDDLPPVFFDHSTAFNWCLLALIAAYQVHRLDSNSHPPFGVSNPLVLTLFAFCVFTTQCFEFAIKWINSKSTAALRAAVARSHVRPQTHRVWIVVTEEAKDFWFWFILVLNVATMACFVEAWYHPYRLSLRDGLCLAFASCCALQWISLVRYLQVNTRFHILGLTLQRGLPRVAQFLAGVLPIFVGYVLFGTIMFGAKVPRFQSAGVTATTLFSVANGDEIHDTFNSVSYTPWIGQVYMYSYMILFSYVVLMVCIGIIEDAFFSAVFPESWPSLDQSEREQGLRRQKAQQQREGTDHSRVHQPFEEEETLSSSA